MGMENRARRLLSQRCHRNSLRLHRRKRAPRHAPRRVAVGVSRHRYYLHLHGFYFQNLCPACGCHGADGNYLCGVFLAPEISAWLAWRHGRDRGGHSSWVVAGHNDRESMEFDLWFGNSSVYWRSALGGAHAPGLSELLLGHSSDGNFQRGRFVTEYRKRGSRRRPLPHLSILDGQWDWFCGGGALRQRLSHNHLSRASWLEATRRPGRLFGVERLVYQFSLLYGDHSIRTGLDSYRSRNWHSALHWNYYRRSGVSGNTERTCSSGGARDCSGIGSLGTADGGNRSASCRQIAFRNRFGSLCSEFSDSRHDRTRTRVIFTSMILAAIGVALIERQFIAAAVWSLVAAFLSAIGIIHAYNLTPGGAVSRFGLLAAPEFLLSYLMLALLFFAAARYAKKR